MERTEVMRARAGAWKDGGTEVWTEGGGGDNWRRAKGQIRARGVGGSPDGGMEGEQWGRGAGREAAVCAIVVQRSGG